MSAATRAKDRRGVPILPLPSVHDIDSPRLWRRVVESRAWPIVLDAGGGYHVDAFLGGPPQSFCARLGASGLEPELLQGAERGLTWTAPWALVLEVADISRVFLADVATRLPMFLLDVRTNRLLRVPGGNGRLVHSFLAASWLETRACAIANAAATRDLIEAP